MSQNEASLSGEWTIHAIAQQRDAVLPLLDGGASEFDVAGITDMDSAGLQLLLAMQRSVAQTGHELRLVRPSSAVQSILRDYGLDATLAAISQGGA